MSEPLALAESKRLVELEEIIEKGVATFVQVGEALAEIRDSRLYRIEYDNFEDYCRDEWNITKTRANQLIGGASVMGNLTTIVAKPATESQARPLTKLTTPEAQREAWQEAVEESGGKPTAKHVEAAVARKMKPIEHAFTPAQEEAAAEAEKDSAQLWLVKSHFKKLTKKDKAAFIEWATTNH